MDYKRLYERLNLFHCHNNGRPDTDSVMLIKMVLIQHLFATPFLRQHTRKLKSIYQTSGSWNMDFLKRFHTLPR